MRLSGKTAVVTGAARGLGRACAVAFARNGADVLLLDIARDLPGVPYPLGSASQLAHTASLCRDHGAAVQTAEADVRDLAAVRDAVGTAYARFGRIDILLNNAGITAPAGRLTHEITEDEWTLMLDVDLSGAWRMIKEVGTFMAESKAGSVINVSSTAGVVGYRHFAGYVAAKHGLVGLTKAAALDFAPLMIRVNALCPGSVADDPRTEGRMLTEITRALDLPSAGHEAVFTEDLPMPSMVEAGDVADAAVWLASDESCRVTGSVITVDGGFTAR
ncbi:MAG TPA: SDR family oxidoreductase [Streptosporangiaceae bacterium]|nr:SDR family oxidoreductase [Streptosporangiaceae bacterium]